MWNAEIRKTLTKKRDNIIALDINTWKEISTSHF